MNDLTAYPFDPTEITSPMRLERDRLRNEADQLAGKAAEILQRAKDESAPLLRAAESKRALAARWDALANREEQEAGQPVAGQAPAAARDGADRG